MEKSSDGIVDYWSSHLPGTRSEVMVPIKHENVDHPEVVKELNVKLAELRVKYNDSAELDQHYIDLYEK